MLCGNTPLVISGFEASTAGIPGLTATAFTITTAGSLVAHPLASDPGTILEIPSDRNPEVLSTSNPNVVGSFTSNAVNFVGIDLFRTADGNTADIMQFFDEDTGQENAQDLPLASTFDYKIYVSTQDFSTTPNLAPLYKVTTDVNNHITAIVDCRSLMFRLGSGGSLASATHTYSWPNGRTEVGDNSDIHVADKTIGSLKNWMDAAMTRLWEIGGGEHWYSETNPVNVMMARTGSPFVSNGQYFEWDGTNLHWKGLVFLFENTTSWNNIVSDQTADAPGAYGTTATNLADGDCLYVDLDRHTNATVSAKKGSLASLGIPTTPGSRFIIAWRKGADVFTRDSYLPVNATGSVATTAAVGTVKLQVTSATPAAPVVFNPGTNGELTVAATGGGVAGIAATSADGPAIAPKGTLNNTSAIVRGVSSDGKARANVDYLGLRSGWVYERQYFSDLPTVGSGTFANANGWNGTTTAAGRLGWSSALGGGTLGGVWPGGAVYVKLNNTRNGADYAYYQSPAWYNSTHDTVTFDPNGYFDQQQIAIEFIFATEENNASVDYFIGWQAGGGSIAPWASAGTLCAGLRLKQSGGDTNWSLFTGNGTTQTVTALTNPIPPTLDARHRVRLELHRSGSPYGACVRVFVDGVLTSTTATLPITAGLGSDLSFQMAMYSTAAVASDANLQFSPIRVGFPNVAAGNLAAGADV